MKRLKLIISLVLSISICFSIFSFPVHATSAYTVSDLSSSLVSNYNSGDSATTAYLTSVAALGTGGGGFGGGGFGRDDFSTNYNNYVTNLKNNTGMSIPAQFEPPVRRKLSHPAGGR